MKITYTIAVIAVIALIGMAIGYNINRPEPPLGGVTVGNEYYATTTASNSSGYLNANNPSLIKKGSGSLGSLIVTSAGTAGGVTNFYDATTTNINLRESAQATTSITLLSVPNDLAAGTYIFDTLFNRGLLKDHTGTIGTTTVTFR